ncbi:MAG TPA: hypothetical protein VJ761_07270, partial [Ktedonobacteraceae bacterium]|nr:hypothetical protein [Ktedonobacteraceae bacterium]
ALWENQYATIPMPTIQPAFQRYGEEELHTSFEQAISDRLMSVNRQFRRPSGPITENGYAQPHTDELVEQEAPALAVPFPADTNPLSHMSTWRQTALMVCLCLILFMVGFDLVGMLLVFVGR